MLPNGSGVTNFHTAPSADATVATKPSDSNAPLIYCGALLSPGSAAATLTIYDGPVASGKIIAQLVGAANGASVADPLQGYSIIINASTIHAALTGTGATADIRFKGA